MTDSKNDSTNDSKNDSTNDSMNAALLQIDAALGTIVANLAQINTAPNHYLTIARAIATISETVAVYKNKTLDSKRLGAGWNIISIVHDVTCKNPLISVSTALNIERMIYSIDIMYKGLILRLTSPNDCMTLPYVLCTGKLMAINNSEYDNDPMLTRAWREGKFTEGGDKKYFDHDSIIYDIEYLPTLYAKVLLTESDCPSPKEADPILSIIHEDQITSEIIDPRTGSVKKIINYEVGSIRIHQ